MPLLTVQTNISVEEKSKELLDLLTDVIAEGTGKPKAYISILLDDNKVMSFGGTTEPCAIISLGKRVHCPFIYQSGEPSIKKISF